MNHTVTTFCRVCEPSCGLVAEVEGGRLLRLWPDREHPVTRGFACHKGLGFSAIHHDPDRLDVPLRRTNERGAEGRFARVTWDEAISDIARRLRTIVDADGPHAVAGYIGNPLAFNALGLQASTSFFAQLGGARMFSSSTQDCSNKFAGSEAVFGTSTLHPVPDLEHTHYALIFGENPKVSHMSFVSMADPMGKLREAKKRGATIRFVNPRRIESASVGEVVQIKPDTDLYFMAALLHEIDAAGLFDEAVIAAHGKHIEGLRAFIAPYSAEKVAPVVGIEASAIRAIGLEFARAASACVHMSTGVNMGRQGTLCYWLLQMLSFVTGNLDRRGGNLYSLGFYPAFKAGKVSSESPFLSSEFGELRHVRGVLPANLLADMIESDTQPIRALILVSGNPLLSVAGEARLRRALEKLEFVVVLDLFRNATAEYADYLLPCTDMLERSDVNICGLGMQYEPFVQYTDAVVPAAAERKEEWWIFARLEQAMGLRSILDHGEAPDVFSRLERMLRSSGLSLAQLKGAPRQTVRLAGLAPGRFFDEFIQTEDKRVDCCPPLFARALARAHAIFEELQREPVEQLKLINLRTIFMQNSWFHNVEKLKGDKRSHNPLHIAPHDALRLGVRDGDAVCVESKWGRIDAIVAVDDTLRPGVVAMTHGWGHQRSAGLRVARKYPGVNVNAILPSGPGSYEPLSNQAHMTGVPVRVVPRASS